MGKLIMPKHTGELVYFQTPLKVYYDAHEWLSMRDFADKLFAELHAIGREAERSSDNTHYTKCAQLPRYFGFVTRKENKRDADAKITPSGVSFYNALLSGDIGTQYRLLVEAFESLTFGRNTEGCGSDSDVEPIGVFFRAVYELNGITGKEYGYLLGELDEKYRNFKDVLNDIVVFRANGNPPPVAGETLAHNLADCKTMKLLKELNFIVEDGSGKMVVAQEVDRMYRGRLLALKITNAPPLKQPFKNWLSTNDYGVSVDSYPRSIEALSMPLRDPMSKTTGSWEGLYEYVIGEEPKTDTFSVTGRHSFDSAYARFSQLMSKSVVPPIHGINPQRHQELIDYTLKSGDSIDKGRLYCAYNAFKKFLTWFDLNKGLCGFHELKGESMDNRILSAIRTKPFILLAGISGTEKSRMVRQLARGCCPRYKEGSTTEDHPLYHEQKPGNFAIIPVRPNWHDSTELMGYESRISTPEFVIKPFVEFLVKAWMNPDVPFFLCLDEMNLASVEQYFAEYLSAIESRKTANGGGRDYIKTDVVVRIGSPENAWDDSVRSVLHNAMVKLFDPYKDASGNLDVWGTYVRELFTKDGGVSIPQNLVVMGTVNMDETTCSFSRKVLDRAMSFELNDVSDMYDPVKIAGEGDYEFGSIDTEATKCELLTGKDAYNKNPAEGDKILKYLETVNKAMEGTQFKIAYRSRNEIMIYCHERTKGGLVDLRTALDEATSMKILSRIEGDDQKFARFTLESFLHTVVKGLLAIDNPGVTDDEVKSFLDDDAQVATSLCASKLKHMADELSNGAGFVSYWE